MEAYASLNLNASVLSGVLKALGEIVGRVYFYFTPNGCAIFPDLQAPVNTKRKRLAGAPMKLRVDLVNELINYQYSLNRESLCLRFDIKTVRDNLKNFGKEKVLLQIDDKHPRRLQIYSSRLAGANGIHGVISLTGDIAQFGDIEVLELSEGESVRHSIPEADFNPIVSSIEKNCGVQAFIEIFEDGARLEGHGPASSSSFQIGTAHGELLAKANVSQRLLSVLKKLTSQVGIVYFRFQRETGKAYLERCFLGFEITFELEVL